MALLSQSQSDNMETIVARIKKQALEAQQELVSSSQSTSKGVMSSLRPKARPESITQTDIVNNTISRLRDKANLAIEEQPEILLDVGFDVEAFTSKPAVTETVSTRDLRIDESVGPKARPNEPEVKTDAVPTMPSSTESNGLMSSLRPRVRPEDLPEPAARVVDEDAINPDNYNFNKYEKPATRSDQFHNVGVQKDALKRLKATLRGPFRTMQDMLDFDLVINDTVVKPGSDRAKSIENGGRPGSRHFHGDALDISTRGLNTEQLEAFIVAAQKSGFKGFGFGGTILHLDMNGGKEKVRTWKYKNDFWSGNEAFPVAEMMARVRKGLP